MRQTKANLKQGSKKSRSIPTVKKGKIVEQIVAAFHENPNVTVRQNVFLRVLGGEGRRREIDVLVEGALLSTLESAVLHQLGKSWSKILLA